MGLALLYNLFLDKAKIRMTKRRIYFKSVYYIFRVIHRVKLLLSTKQKEYVSISEQKLSKEDDGYHAGTFATVST